MTNRPLLQPNLRMIVTPDEDIQELGPEVDTLEAEVNRRARKASFEGVGHIHAEEDEHTNSIIFDLGISQTGYVDIDNLQNEIREATNNMLGVSVGQTDVTLDANIKRVYGLRD